MQTTFTGSIHSRICCYCMVTTNTCEALLSRSYRKKRKKEMKENKEESVPLANRHASSYEIEVRAVAIDIQQTIEEQ